MCFEIHRILFCVNECAAPLAYTRQLCYKSIFVYNYIIFKLDVRHRGGFRANFLGGALFKKYHLTF